MNYLRTLWDVALQLIEYINVAWNWLIKPLEISIPISIPYILPDGITWDFGITPISLLGVGLIGLFIYWLVWA